MKEKFLIVILGNHLVFVAQDKEQIVVKFGLKNYRMVNDPSAAMLFNSKEEAKTELYQVHLNGYFKDYCLYIQPITIV